MPPKLNLSNQRFGRLLALEDVGVGNGFRLWRCRCDCGNETICTVGNLRTGNSQSCGCIVKERASRLNPPTHGGKGTPEFAAWTALRNRCLNPRNKDYPNYGGRGITVSERWSVFENFLADMGKRPTPDHSIDRMDNDGPYAPDNCHWATRSQQAVNRRH